MIFNKDFSEGQILQETFYYTFKLETNYYLCKKITIGGTVILSFKDTLLDYNNLLHFKREVYSFNENKISRVYICKDNVILAKAKNIIFKLWKKVNKSTEINRKMLTMYFETKLINGKLQAICLSLYDGKILESFWINKFKNSDEMILSALNFINRPKYHGYKIYFHNLALFDSVFILNKL